jgi:hypothetical protein
MFDTEMLERLSQEIEGQEVGWDSYAQPSEYVAPPAPGKYSLFVRSIDELGESDDKLSISAQLTYEIVGSNSYDGRTLPFNRLSSRKFKRGNAMASTLDDLLWATDSPRCVSNYDRGQALKSLVDQQTRFAVKYDWRGFCTHCYEEALKAATSQQDIEAAKQMATPEQKKAASQAATVAKNHRGFPTLPNGEQQEFLLCPKCQSEVRAQGNIVTYLRVTP